MAESLTQSSLEKALRDAAAQAAREGKSLVAKPTAVLWPAPHPVYDQKEKAND